MESSDGDLRFDAGIKGYDVKGEELDVTTSLIQRLPVVILNVSDDVWSIQNEFLLAVLPTYRRDVRTDILL